MLGKDGAPVNKEALATTQQRAGLTGVTSDSRSLPPQKGQGSLPPPTSHAPAQELRPPQGRRAFFQSHRGTHHMLAKLWASTQWDTCFPCPTGLLVASLDSTCFKGSI